MGKTSHDNQKKTQADQFKWLFLHPRYWLTWLGLGFSILPTLLPYSLILKVGKLLGQLFYHVGGSRVHVARVNLQQCFPDMSDKEREKLLRANFQASGIGIMEVAIAWWWPRKKLEQLVRFENLDYLRQAEGEGIILLILHFTTIEIAGALICLRHGVNATYREHKNPVFEYMQRRQRRRYSSASDLLGREDVRGMLRVLRSGGTVWYAPDQDYGPRHSVFVPFFGVNTATVTGTSRLAKIGKARVIPMVVTRQNDDSGYTAKVYAPWQNFPQGDEVEDARRVNRFIEERVREYPEQYMWLHRRFKTRPEGEPSFYQKKK